MIARIPMFFLLPVLAVAQHFDLGGPCAEHPADTALFGEVAKATELEQWDRVVELRKLEVRDACQIEFRWAQLASALVKANRPTEAIAVLEEMDSRGFALNPSPGVLPSELLMLMNSVEFRATPVGQRIEKLKRTSDARREHFREVLAKLPPAQRPSANYIAKGACPFECCQYREWTVEAPTQLFAAPGSGKIVGTAKKGMRVRGLTGEVHLTPKPVVVVGGESLPANTIAFVLDNQGEGYGNVYSGGRILSLPVNVLLYCPQPSETCWGETLLPANQIKPPVWWVKIRLPNGTIGWTDKPEHFGNKDSCG